MASFLVTGAAGFVGSNLVETLLERGHEVIGVDNFETGRRQNLNDVTGKFEFHEVDIRNFEQMVDLMEDVKYVLHQAAVPSVPRSLEEPRLVTSVNCMGSTTVYEAARQSGVEKIVVASSSSIYGPGQELPKREDMCPNPASPYALSKFWTERMALQYAKFFDIDAVALRYFNVFGPNQDPTSNYAAVIPKFIGLMLDGERPTIYGDGEQSRDFTFVENVVEANIQAALSDCSGEVLNVGTGSRTTVNRLVILLNEILDTDIDPEHDDPRPGDVRHSLASIEKASEHIGYKPVVQFEQGLERTVDHFWDQYA